MSVPKNAGAMPYYYNHKLKSGGTPFAFHFGALYPFGYGLGWTQFRWGAARLAESRVPIDGEVALSVDITNTGERSGSEVVQVYVRDKVATQVRPLQELKAFQRVTLSPGETATLTFTLPVEMFNFTRRDGKRIIEPGEFELQVGASSADIREAVNVLVTGETRELAGNGACSAAVTLHGRKRIKKAHRGRWAKTTHSNSLFHSGDFHAYKSRC